MSNSPLPFNVSLYLPLSDKRVRFDSKIASQIHRSLKQFPSISRKTRVTKVFAFFPLQHSKNYPEAFCKL